MPKIRNFKDGSSYIYNEGEFFNLEIEGSWPKFETIYVKIQSKVF